MYYIRTILSSQLFLQRINLPKRPWVHTGYFIGRMFSWARTRIFAAPGASLPSWLEQCMVHCRHCSTDPEIYPPITSLNLHYDLRDDNCFSILSSGTLTGWHPPDPEISPWIANRSKSNCKTSYFDPRCCAVSIHSASHVQQAATTQPWGHEHM